MIAWMMAWVFFATSPETRFVQANAAYEAGDFDAAAALYEGLLADDPGLGHLWYNLGNAELRRGHLGAGIAAYRRALHVLPRNSDVRANLTSARAQVRDAIEPAETSALWRTVLFWHHLLSARELLQLAVAVNALLWACALVRLLRRMDGLAWVVGALAVVLVAAVLSLAARRFWPQRVAVVTAESIDVHSSTSSKSVVRFQLHAGAEVTWREARGDWTEVQLADGKRGWLESAGVANLSL